MKDDIFMAARDLEKSLGLPDNFIPKLLKEDDWSFIIKIHVLMEAAISFLLLEKLRNHNLSEVLSRLELSNKKTGKIAFVKSLELLDKDIRRFINTISEIRNKFVHNIEYITTDLTGYFFGLNLKEQNSLLDSLTFSFNKKDNKIPKKKIDRNYLKMCIWFGLVYIFSLIYIEKEKSETQKRYEKLSKDILLSSSKIGLKKVKKEQEK